MLILKTLGFLVLVVAVKCQVLSRVYLTNSNDYTVSVLNDAVSEVENRHWSNLKLDDVTYDVNETVLGEPMLGQVDYTNGFVVSIQRISIMRTSLNQFWTTVAATSTVQVELRATIRMEGVAMGWDVTANIDGTHHYTGLITHPVITFDFSIFRNVHTHAMEVRVSGGQTSATNLEIDLMPDDDISDKIVHLYNVTSTVPAVQAWGTDILQPIVSQIVQTTPFPELCYDCTLLDANPGWE